MNSCLRGPDVGAHVGDVLVDVVEEGHAELGVLLVCRVVRELAEALGVERFPHELIEGPNTLRDSRPLGVEVVLVADDLGSRSILEGGKVKPVGRVAHGMRCRCHGHRDAVVPKPHADVSHYDRRAVCAFYGTIGGGWLGGLGGICTDVEGRAVRGDYEVPHAEHIANHGRGSCREVIDGLGVIAKATEVALLRLDGLLVRCVVLLVAKDASRPVCRRFHRILLDPMWTEVIASLSS